MQRINEFIEKLEANKTTPNERRGFISSLTKKEFIYFLKQDFSSNTQRSIDIRSDLFEEYINQTKQIISEFTLSELKDILHKIKPQYITIKNLFIEHLINIIHESEEEIDIKRIVEFKHRVANGTITYEDIRTTLLKMKKEEFSILITLDRQEITPELDSISTYDKKLDEMYEYQAEIIAEILEEYTEDEMIDLIPFLNDSSSRIRTMFFKCFNERIANEIFLTNAPKYSKDIFSYIVTPTQNNEKDEMIISILSNPKLYSLYSNHELQYLRTLISNKETILDENSNIINTTEEEIKKEAAKYIANLRCRIKQSISRGILKKLSAKKLHDLLNEVNKGLLNIGEEEISFKEFISLTEMPLDKAVLFLKSCIELTEEEKKEILSTLYKDNEYNKCSINEAANRVSNKYMKIAEKMDTKNNEDFSFIYCDLLEKNYNKQFFDNLLKNFAKLGFITIPADCMNIFLSQLIDKTSNELGIEVQKEFYVGKSFVFGSDKRVTIGNYSSNDNKITINTNAYIEVEENKEDTPKRKKIRSFMNRIAMIEAVFHELRHAYQFKIMKRVGTVRDLYFLLDDLLHSIPLFGNIYYTNNYEDDSKELDAQLYSLISTASLLRVDPAIKDMYWQSFSQDAKELSRKRKAPQLRKKWSYQKDSEKTSLIDLVNELLGGPRLESLAEEYPMLAIISDEGYILNEDKLIERYMAIELSLKEDNLDDKSYEEGHEILRFLGEYLAKIHNKKMKQKKSI
ncbi:MAG: hypothetical protein E7171_04310 [Firmicutes bacterium]|nr:hypothetical protein [Bacillota bacterium]